MRLTALLHDAAEAYIGDYPKPFKVQIPAIKEAEERIEIEIAKKFGTIYPFPDEIHVADVIMGHNEAYQMVPEVPWIEHDKLLNFTAVELGWTALAARTMFQKAFIEYTALT
jgi:hypothetical protein